MPEVAKCFNRTFMELKYNRIRTTNKFWGVLIVPLWNWNMHQPERLPRLQMVLIVPLWNWNTFEQTAREISLCFNRTFMELKFIRIRNFFVLNTVLIVPLWNWNIFDAPITVLVPKVLIVPLWNWNEC